jgi:hypothetical protein
MPVVHDGGEGEPAGGGGVGSGGEGGGGVGGDGEGGGGVGGGGEGAGGEGGGGKGGGGEGEGGEGEGGGGEGEGEGGGGKGGACGGGCGQHVPAYPRPAASHEISQNLLATQYALWLHRRAVMYAQPFEHVWPLLDMNGSFGRSSHTMHEGDAGSGGA